MDEEMFTNRDLDASYDPGTCIQVTFNGDQITATSDSVQISGTTITLTEEATYLISGTLDDGILIIDADENAKLQLVLNGVDIHSQTMAPLYIRTADKVYITLAEGTTNTLSNGGTITSIDDNNIDATLFSKQDLTINGSGTLTITSPSGHGIVCKDDLVMTGGVVSIKSAAHGIDANGTLVISGGSTTIVGPTQGDTSILDYDISATIIGGTFIGTGAFGMAQTFSNASQGVISVSVGNQSAGTEIGLYDADGNTILTYTPEEDFQMLILSRPQLALQESYILMVGTTRQTVRTS